MSIHQLSVRHDERQDRLLWRMNTKEGQEYQFWLTRRMWTRLLPVLNQALLKLQVTEPGLAVSDTASLQLLREFKRENLMAHADFKTPFVSDPKDKPLGPSPMLVTDAHLSLDTQGSLALVLEEKMGDRSKSCQLNLASELVEGLLLLTQQALQSADWSVPHHDGLPAERLAGASSGQPYKH